MFIASAITDVSLASVLATQDYLAGDLRGDHLRKIGLEVPEAVSSAMAPSIPPAIQTEIEQLSLKITAGEIEIPEDYDGLEFEL